MNRIKTMTLQTAAAVAFAAALLASGGAFASTAANTQITNTATVNYNDAGGIAQTAVTATASVTVTLVPSAPTLSSPPNQTISQGTSATLTYTITGTANGPDTYNLSSTIANSGVSAVTGTFSAPSVTLGGTTLAVAAANGDTSITVPYDNGFSPSANVVNGIAVGAVIVINGNAYTVSSVTKNAGANTATIGITTAIAGGAVAAGSVVGERKTFTETVPSGTITAPATSGTQTVNTTATSATSPNPATTQTTPTVITVQRPQLTVVKEVSTDGGTTFATTGNAAPGTSLVYRITATNSGATNALAVSFTDVIPPYLTYVNGSGKTSTTAGQTYSAAPTALTEGSGGYTFSGGTVGYSPPGAGGTVAGGGVLVLYFRATIN